MSEDRELDRILEEKRKRLLSRLAKANRKNEPQKEVDDINRTILGLLDDRGREILAIAEKDFPEETRRAKLLLYMLFKKGYVEGPVDAGDFYRFLRYLGIPIRYESKIFVASKGEKKSLSQILSERFSEME